MAKITIRQQPASSSTANANNTQNTPAILSLIFGIIGFFIPFLGAIIAVICGHIGRKNTRNGAKYGIVALVGLILGYIGLVLSLLIVLAILLIPGYQNYVMRQKALPANQNEIVSQQPTDTEHDAPTAALEMAELWVDARVAKGIPLNEVNETLSLEAQQKKYWHKMTIRQGSVLATPAQGGSPLVLMSMQNGQKIEWACAGEVPQFAEAFCSKAK